MLEAVTKDQLNTGLTGQIRYRVSERNLYAYLFGVKNPIAHVMGYFVSILRERIANFEAPARDRRRRRQSAESTPAVQRRLDQRSAQEPARSQRTHGSRMPVLGRALRHHARRLAHHRASIRRRRSNRRWPPSTPRTTTFRPTSAWRRRRRRPEIVQSKRAVEIETLKAQAEVEPLTAWPSSSRDLKRSGPARWRATCATCASASISQAQRRDSWRRSDDRRARRDSWPARSLTFGALFLLMLAALLLVRLLGLYTIVGERECQVYVLFGKVMAILDEPGLHFLPLKLGAAAFIVNWLGHRHVLDMRLDQEYLRSQPVNSEEGAPMGIGIWYEMFISDPVAYLFKNADPRGSLRANVSNATVRCLSNMPLADMLETRHTMSQSVRDEVSPQVARVGLPARLGVHPQGPLSRRRHDPRRSRRRWSIGLRQVTSAIQQDGANQVSIITSTAERHGRHRVRQSRRSAPAHRRCRACNIARTPRSSRRCSRSSRPSGCSKAKEKSRSCPRAPACSRRSLPQRIEGVSSVLWLEALDGHRGRRGAMRRAPKARTGGVMHGNGPRVFSSETHRMVSTDSIVF